MTNYRGRITRIIGNDVYVQVSALAVDQDFGPMDLADAANYNVDDYVLIAQVDGAAEDIVIVGKLLADLSEIGPAIVLPTTANSFLTGQADGSYAWGTTAQTKTVLGVDTNTTNIATNTSAIAALQTEVQPVNRGGTGKTSYTTGNYIQATGPTTLSERTPTQVKSDLGLAGAITTAPADLPVSTATQTALNLKKDKDGPAAVSGVDFNTVVTAQDLSIGATNIAASTNAPPSATRGILTVTTSGGYITQRYQMVDSGKIWTRVYYPTTWSAWMYSGGGEIPHAFVYKTASTTDFPVALTQIDMPGNRTLRGGMTNSGGTVTIPMDGAYKIDFAAHVQSTSTTGSKTYYLRHTSGAAIIASYASKFDGTNESDALSVTVYLTAGNNVGVYLDHSGPATGVTVYGVSNFYTYLTVTYVGP